MGMKELRKVAHYARMVQSFADIPCVQSAFLYPGTPSCTFELTEKSYHQTISRIKEAQAHLGFHYTIPVMYDKFIQGEGFIYTCSILVGTALEVARFEKEVNK